MRQRGSVLKYMERNNIARGPNMPVKRRPVNVPLFVGLLVVTLAVMLALLLRFPNLRGHPGYLALAMLTPLLAGMSVALRYAYPRDRVPRDRVPRAASLGLRAALVAVVVLDAIFFVSPIFIQTTAHESAPTFASATSVPAQSTGSARPAQTPIAPATRSGAFDHRSGIDTVAGHAMLGTATDGTLILRLEDLHATHGPDLYVYLTRVASPQTADEVQRGYEVSTLKATTGDQNYTLPAGTDLSQYKAVVIFCKSFSVIFGYANLT